MDTQPLRSHRRILTASIVGTAVEYYDFYLYGYAAALVFGPLFFPVKSAAAQTLLALVSFGLAFVARPIGAITFGHFGDRIGRKSMLIATMLLMGICTLAIAFIPTYATAGWIAPALLCLARFGQGFGLGGEWAGAALLSIETAPEGWDCRFGTMPALGSAIGNMAATSVLLTMGAIMPGEDFVAWGWRVPFLASAVLIAIGLWVRLRVADTPEFREALTKEAPPRIPIVRLFAESPLAVLTGCISLICGFALVYMAGPFALAQGTGPLGYDRETFLLIQLSALFCALPFMIFFAAHADRTNNARYVLVAALGTVPVGVLFGPALASGSLLIIGAILFACNACWAISNSSFSTWLCRLYPVRVRYSGFAFAFNTGGVIGGACIPIIAQMMSNAGNLRYAGLLLSGAGLLTFAAVMASRALQRDSAIAQPATA
ncbi:MFS transporter [Sphingomonas hankyongi]|uniref:MFS transporter n=1 Tax=Sphingomonas hankyongi TaxID=2908209 RepID=A0ABT0RYM5_9SPHN|nr:MFS transporter [Sphingomonas hankyongi]